jgi:RHS repeat-associated protein
MTFQNGSTTDGAYTYDGFSRIVQRVVSNVSPAGTTQYLYDEFGHVVLETDGAGNSLREYIWLGDMPVAIVDQVNTTTPVLYYVHADHLDRPIMVTNSAGASVWQAVWTPFGAPQSITGSLTYNARFPGQWFQIENGLNYNWNRHYDPSTGRYVQPDPTGLETLLSDGPSVYGYVGQSPLSRKDSAGMSTAPEPNYTPLHRPPVAGVQICFAATLIPGMGGYDEQGGYTHCWYNWPSIDGGPFAIEHKGYHRCEATVPGP